MTAALDCAPAEPPVTPPARLDVVVCAHNEADHVPRVLQSLQAQTVGQGAFRVLFIDNASTDDTRAVVEAHRGGLNLTYILEPRAGVSYARTTGNRSATADFVAYIDADSRAHPAWVETISRVLDAHNPDLCGGPYYAFYSGPKPAWFRDRYNSRSLGDVPRALGPREYLSGTNMIWRRRLVDELGGFNPAIGVVGRQWLGGEEAELIRRAREGHGDFKAYYHPGIIVYHLTRPEALNLRYWARRYFRSGRVYRTAFPDADQPFFWPAVRLMGHAAIDTVYVLFGLGLARRIRSRRQYPYYENYVFERMLPAFKTLGELCERFPAIEKLALRSSRLRALLGL